MDFKQRNEKATDRMDFKVQPTVKETAKELAKLFAATLSEVARYSMVVGLAFMLKNGKSNNSYWHWDGKDFKKIPKPK